MNAQTYQRMIFDHLTQNGKITDKEGLKIAGMFLRKLLKEPAILDVIGPSPLSFSDVMAGYIAATDFLMPNPLIKFHNDTTVLAVHALFLETKRLESCIYLAVRNLEAAGLPIEASDRFESRTLPEDVAEMQREPSERRKLINSAFVQCVKALRDHYNSEFGEAEFQINPNGKGVTMPGSGCVPLVLIGLFLGLSGALWVLTLV